MPESVEHLLPRLRDPHFTRVPIVTLAEATRVHEAAALQRDLRRAEIEPYAWVINQSLTPLPVADSLLRARQVHERPYIREVVEQQATRTYLIPWQLEPPVGRDALHQLMTGERHLPQGTCS
jgi:arsenite-transporting ATPase